MATTPSVIRGPTPAEKVLIATLDPKLIQLIGIHGLHPKVQANIA